MHYGISLDSAGDRSFVCEQALARADLLKNINIFSPLPHSLSSGTRRREWVAFQFLDKLVEEEGVKEMNLVNLPSVRKPFMLQKQQIKINHSVI